jgi:hypothetical protein
LREVLDLLPVLGRQEDGLDARSERTDQLLLDASDCGDLAPQTELALFT